MNKFKSILKSIKTPLILSVLPNIILSSLMILLVIAISETGTTSNESFLFLPIIWIVNVFLTLLNPAYFLTYFYMRRNHKNADNSIYYGLNIVFISMFMYSLFSIFLEILASLLIFNKLSPLDKIINSGQGAIMPDMEVFFKMDMYTRSIEQKVTEFTFGLEFPIFLVISFIGPIFFIIYGLAYTLRHCKYKFENQNQIRIFKTLVLLLPVNLFFLILIPFLTQQHIVNILNDSVQNKEISTCDKINHHSLKNKCIRDFVVNEEGVKYCEDLNDSYYLVTCIDEASPKLKNWRTCYDLDPDNINRCLSGVGRDNYYFLDPLLCEALAATASSPFEEDGGSIHCYATIAAKTENSSYCNYLSNNSYRDECFERIENISKYQL